MLQSLGSAVETIFWAGSMARRASGATSLAWRKR
jgi:hypothetical protein